MWVEVNLVAVSIMRHYCDDPKHGYSQGVARYGDDEICVVQTPKGPVLVRGGDRDCSWGVCSAYEAALEGSPYEGCLDGVQYTGDMQYYFTKSGLFDWHPMGDGYIAQPGDIYLYHNWINNQGHTAMCISAVPDLLGEFYIAENGTIYGQKGDQTGWESRIRSYYDFPWSGILAYNHKADWEDDMPTADEIAKAVWNRELKGVKAGDRLYLDNKQLFDREDYSERGRDGYTIVERVCYLAAKLDNISDKLDEIEKKLGDDDGK